MSGYKTKRPDTLHGVTYKAEYTTQEGVDAQMYITINESESRPYEVFIRLDTPELFEWMTALTLIITRSLRAGESLQNIARELSEIRSPRSRHMIPKGGGDCPSLAARIGKILGAHVDRGEV
jgi:hypothetical protein